MSNYFYFLGGVLDLVEPVSGLAGPPPGFPVREGFCTKGVAPFSRKFLFLILLVEISVIGSISIACSPFWFNPTLNTTLCPCVSDAKVEPLTWL